MLSLTCVSNLTLFEKHAVTYPYFTNWLNPCCLGESCKCKEVAQKANTFASKCSKISYNCTGTVISDLCN